jgi:hypothetical protein
MTGALKPFSQLIPIDDTVEMGADRRNCQKSSFQSHDEGLFLSKGHDLTYLEIGYLSGDEDFCLFPASSSWPEECKNAPDEFADDNGTGRDPRVSNKSPS